MHLLLHMHLSTPSHATQHGRLSCTTRTANSWRILLSSGAAVRSKQLAKHYWINGAVKKAQNAHQMLLAVHKPPVQQLSALAYLKTCLARMYCSVLCLRCCPVACCLLNGSPAALQWRPPLLCMRPDVTVVQHLKGRGVGRASSVFFASAKACRCIMQSRYAALLP